MITQTLVDDLPKERINDDIDTIILDLQEVAAMSAQEEAVVRFAPKKYMLKYT